MMKTRPILAFVALALAGSAAAQHADTPMSQTPLFAQGRHAFAMNDVPPLPPGCLDELPQPPPRPALPDFTQDTKWQGTLGISAAQARQVQQVLEQQADGARRFEEQRRKADAATCDKVRGIVGDKAMKAWAEAAPVPPPPPRPPMPPEPPQAPVPPDTAR